MPQASWIQTEEPFQGTWQEQLFPYPLFYSPDKDFCVEGGILGPRQGFIRRGLFGNLVCFSLDQGWQFGHAEIHSPCVCLSEHLPEPRRRTQKVTAASQHEVHWGVSLLCGIRACLLSGFWDEGRVGLYFKLFCLFPRWSKLKFPGFHILAAVNVVLKIGFQADSDVHCAFYAWFQMPFPKLWFNRRFQRLHEGNRANVSDFLIFNEFHSLFSPWFYLVLNTQQGQIHANKGKSTYGCLSWFWEGGRNPGWRSFF